MADRWGARSVVAVNAVVIGVFQLATCHAGNVATLLTLRFIVGLGLGGAVPGFITVVSQVVPAKLQHRVQGFIWACFPLGAMLGGLVSSRILNDGRWETIFVVGGVAPLVVALAVWSIGPLPRAHEARVHDWTLSSLGTIAGSVWTRALLTGLIFFFTNGAIAVVLNWTPSLLVRSGYVAASGASALAWNAAGALASMAISGFIVERSKIVPVIFGLAAATVATVLFSAFMHSPWAVTLLMVVQGSMLGLSGTAAVFLAGALFPGNKQASGIGFCMAIGRVGQMIFPGVIGLSLQAGASPSGALLLTATLPASGACAALILRIKSNNTRP
jgi:predicted MFS family arabinose efflux permease